MSKGFSGMPGNMKGIFDQAQKMQKQLQKIQEEAEARTSEGSAGGGMVKASVNGKNKLLSLSIDPQVVNKDDVEMLQDLIIAAVNEASQHAADALKEEMSKVTGGMNIPGLF
jgi:DNA-binding YbaB/EbfC family protein